MYNAKVTIMIKHSSNHAKLTDLMPWNRDIEYARPEESEALRREEKGEEDEGREKTSGRKAFPEG